MMSIKYYISTLVLLLALVTSLAQRSSNSKNNQKITTSKQIDTQSQHLIYKGQLVEVYAEKAIFHWPANRNFFMKFSIKNISSKAVGLDISGYWKVMYPNQWGVYKNTVLDLDNERRKIPDHAFDTSKILKMFKDKSLKMINPNETLEYYRDWNGRGEKVELKNSKEYLIISIDGQLLITNGEHLENLNLGDDEKRVIVLHYPIKHKAIPEKSLIIK